MTDSALNAFVWRGTHTARLALTPSPPTSSNGYFAYETDTGNSYAWDGSAWQLVNTAGAVTALTRVTTSGSQSSVTIGSISGSGRNMRIIVNGRGDTAALTTQLKMQFNTDTGSNYDYQYVAGINNAASAANAQAQTSFLLGDLVAASATAGRASGIVVDIPNYAGTTFDKLIAALSSACWGTSAGNQEAIFFSGNWRSTAAINAVKVFPAAGNFVDGTTVDIYLW